MLENLSTGNLKVKERSHGQMGTIMKEILRMGRGMALVKELILIHHSTRGSISKINRMEEVGY